MTEKNAERVDRQRKAPITVVIGNPPYNMNQQNENDNNKNRKYPVIDSRVAATYGKESKATNKGSLSDPYFKFFRWAADRLHGRDGIVTLVTNNRFVNGIATDGFRKSLTKEFDSIYHVDLKGDASTTGEQRRREGGNIFSDKIKVGVGVTVVVRNRLAGRKSLRYFAVPDYWGAAQKAHDLGSSVSIYGVRWESLSIDGNGNWQALQNVEEFEGCIPIDGDKVKTSPESGCGAIFSDFSRGIETCRDAWTYDFDSKALAEKVKVLVDNYNAELDRWRRAKKPEDLDQFVINDKKKIKWCSRLKEALRQEVYAEFDPERIRWSLYRPYTRRFVYVDPILTHRRGVFPGALPGPSAEEENRLIWVKAGMNWAFFALTSKQIVDVLPQSGSHCFPFYVYDEDGTNRRENITDWALEHFCEHYKDKQIIKWDIFYYVYGILHDPEYRTKYAENLKRELPRIPLAKDFWGFSRAGKELARLHIDYESLDPYPLRFVEASASFGVRELAPAFGPPKLASAGKAAASRRTPKPAAAGLPLSYRVEDKMRLAKDRRALKVNDTLTLGGIPPETFGYRLGNRSALEWVIDQYQVTEDKHTGIRSDPNRADDPEYIVRLVGQVIRVSIESVKLVNSLPAL